MDVIERARALRPIIVKAMEGVDDSTAAKAGELFDRWKEDEAVEVGDRRYYPPTGRLYKAIQAHTTQEDWTPDITPALWAVIDVTHAGTLDDPIPAAVNMEYISGLYYLDPTDSKIYLCNRSTGIAVAYLPHELVGHYFSDESE
ncbi:MAG: carbohydrate-binding protein [Acutalibacteraceae bacterium]